MGLVSRIAALEDREPQPCRSHFVLIVAPPDVRTREQHEAWSKQHRAACDREGIPVFTLEIPWTRGERNNTIEDRPDDE